MATSGWDKQERPHMPMSERAKIFMPFSPLRGFEEALRERERLVERRAEHGEPDEDDGWDGELDPTDRGWED